MNTEATTANLFTIQDTDILVGALRILETNTSKTAEERLTQSWICDEIVRRFPTANAALEAWVEDDDTDLTYTGALLQAIGA